jgi:hypothetical protein
VAANETAAVKEFYRFVERAERTVVLLKAVPAASAKN